MTLEELREEYDWIYEFQSRMAERISGNPDVHNHVDYVNRLEAENAKLRELVREMWLYDYAGKFSTARGDVEHVAMVYQRMCELGIEVDA